NMSPAPRILAARMGHGAAAKGRTHFSPSEQGEKYERSVPSGAVPPEQIDLFPVHADFAQSVLATASAVPSTSSWQSRYIRHRPMRWGLPRMLSVSPLRCL